MASNFPGLHEYDVELFFVASVHGLACLMVSFLMMAFLILLCFENIKSFFTPGSFFLNTLKYRSFSLGSRRDDLSIIFIGISCLDF